MTDYIDDAFLPERAVWDGLQTLTGTAMQDRYLLPSQSSPFFAVNEDDAGSCQLRSYDPSSSTYQQSVTELQDYSVGGPSLALRPMNHSSEIPSALNRTFTQVGKPSAGKLITESGPGEDVWERHKPMITDLYAENPLRKVIEIMKRNVKMYKDRFRKWGVGKNVKSHEKEAVIRKQLQHSRAGQSTYFYIRGSQIPEHKIKRHVKATKLFPQEQVPRLRAETPPDLICYTRIASPLSTPTILEIPERIAREVQHYVDSCLRSGLWKMVNDERVFATKVTEDSIFHCFSSCSYALREFNVGEVKAAWQSLSLGMGHVEQAVSEEDPDTLETLIRLIFRFINSHTAPGVASTLLTQFSAMSAAIKPKQHPFNQILPRLIGQDILQLEHTLAIALHSLIDSFDQIVGPFSCNALFYQANLLHNKSHDKSGWTESLFGLLQEFEQALGASDGRCLYIRLELSRSYLRSNQPRKASEIAGSIVRLASAKQSTTRVIGLLSEAYAYQAEAHYQLSEMDLAEQNLRQSILTRVETFGGEEYRVLGLMANLRSWLEEWGRVDEAAELRRQRDEIFDAEYERFAMEERERYQRLQFSSE